MATERTLVLVKPDGVRRGLAGEVISRLEAKGLTLVAMELRTLDRATAEEHYGEHKERPFFGELVEFITSAPLVALVVEGPNAVAGTRRIMGVTNPVEATPGSIRALRPWARQRNPSSAQSFSPSRTCSARWSQPLAAALSRRMRHRWRSMSATFAAARRSPAATNAA